MLISFNWLKEFVDIKLKAKELAHILTMAGFEVEAVAEDDGDAILDINVTPNRGDCLSVIGIAREVAAITGGKVKIPPFPPLKKGGEGGFNIKDIVTVSVLDKLRCPRYSARVIKGVKIAPSPEWLTKRLEACGIRAINNVVDATNFMMLATGQPFHAFDARFIGGNKIIVKTADKEFEFTALDGIKRKITKDDLLICDAEKAIAIAGVMGGANSEVKADTTDIILESACFLPSSVRRTSKRLGLSSESSRRFERCVDPSSTVEFLDLLASLIVEIAGGTPSSDRIDIKTLSKPLKVKFDHSEIKRLLGIDVPKDRAARYLQSLGMKVAKNICTIPPWRPDLTRPADIVEEIARLNGYEKIPAEMPYVKMDRAVRLDSSNADESARELLTAQGFYEALNLGFASPSELEPFKIFGEPVEISNPLSGSLMRTTLLPGLLNNLKLNINFGSDSCKLFELRRVFLRNENKIEEKVNLSGVIYGKRSPLQWSVKQENVDLYDAKGICESLADALLPEGLEFKRKEYSFLRPNASAVIIYNGEEIGFLGLLHPSTAMLWDIKEDTALFELDFDKWAKLSLKRKSIFKELDKFPSIRRDVALLLSEDAASEDVVSAVKEYKNSLIKNVMPFDLYKGKGIPAGRKSLAFAVMYMSEDRTLTDDEVNNAHCGLVSYLKEKLGAEIR